MSTDVEPELMRTWRKEQQRLKKLMREEDDLEFALDSIENWDPPEPKKDKQKKKKKEEPPPPAPAAAASAPKKSTWAQLVSTQAATSEEIQQHQADMAKQEPDPPKGERKLKYVGGVDISFLKDTNTSVATLVVMEYPSMELVWRKFLKLEIDLPYIPGYLAFREVEPLVKLIEEVRKTDKVPQVLLVDGNGKLHYVGFGLACHLGVLADIPTIGVGKNLLYVDGLNREGVTEDMEKAMQAKGSSDIFSPLKGDSGAVWGSAYCSAGTSAASNAVFISVGHRISLGTAERIVRVCSKFRIPEPVRQADLLSRDLIKSCEAALRQGAPLPDLEADVQAKKKGKPPKVKKPRAKAEGGAGTTTPESAAQALVAGTPAPDAPGNAGPEAAGPPPTGEVGSEQPSTGAQQPAAPSPQPPGEAGQGDPPKPKPAGKPSWADMMRNNK